MADTRDWVIRGLGPREGHMSQAINQQGILLESGTNEMELLEFYLQQQRFGVNVAKIRQLMPYHSSLVTRMVGAHEYILGTMLWQGH